MKVFCLFLHIKSTARQDLSDSIESLGVFLHSYKETTFKGLNTEITKMFQVNNI